jgi:adenylate cyclase
MEKLRLVSVQGEGSFELAPGKPLVLGRSGGCDVPIYDATISRRHALLEVVAGGLKIEDVGSTNGTFLGAQRLAEPVVAAVGAFVTFGQVEFHLETAAESPARRAEAEEELAAAAQIRRRLPVSARFAPAATPTESGASLLDLPGETTEERQARRLALLLDISKELSKQPEVDRLLEKVVDLTFQVMTVDRVAMLMLTEDGGELVPRISRSRKGGGADAGYVPRSIARRAVEERVALLTGNAPLDERFGGGSILVHRVQSAMCAPLVGSQGQVLGVLYVDNRTLTHSFGDEELEFLIAFSGIAAVALENSRLIERSRREAVVLSNFQRYFAPDIAHQIAAEEADLAPGGSKRQAVILFSDIRGFTELSEGMRPDDIATLLNEYFTEMVQVVFEHEGMLDKFIGDAVMALWGAPIAHADDADRAVAAAVAMQQALAELNRLWERQGRPQLAVGIGINAGEVFAGNIGSNRRLEYTVIGDPVNTASRLCEEAGRGEILVSEAVSSALTRPPPMEALAPLKFKGKAAAVPVFRVAWEESATESA